MRILFVHSAKVPYPLHKDAYHKKLVQKELKDMEDLENGKILGCMLVDDVQWYTSDMGRKERWAVGPLCYHIKDVFRLSTGIDAQGKLGTWSIPKKQYKVILEEESVKKKLKQWEDETGDELYKENGALYSAITIKQPFVEAILCGIKKVENRKRPIFRLTNTGRIMLPQQIQCRFCGTHINCCCARKKLKRVRKVKTVKKHKIEKKLICLEEEDKEFLALFRFRPCLEEEEDKGFSELLEKEDVEFIKLFKKY